MAELHSSHSKKNQAFGRLLSGAINSIATYEGKTNPIIEEEMGRLVNLSVASVQRYKAGYLPPDAETVRIFAEAGVRRGYLDRRWLEKFLREARYPAAGDLIEALCPQKPPVAETSEQSFSNLPAPAYSRFVMREGPFEDMLSALRQRTALVVVPSLGGMGKTSLAREVAARCLQGLEGLPRFAGVVWVSDAERPGTTTLSTVLDEVAHTLRYDGYTEYQVDDKCRAVEQLLRRYRILLVVDNFETVTDPALLRWLLKLPEPSKGLITTREYRREFRAGTFSVELRGMSEAESLEFVEQRLQVLHMNHLADSLKQFAPIIEVTGGNPKAIEMAMGCLKYERRPLQEVVDDLYEARGEMFSDLFQRSWALLDEGARRVLYAMTLFGASADREALSAVADIRGLTFARALERLTDLAFLDVQQADLLHEARYALHPLVRSFARTELAKEPAFASGARQRWLAWYINLVSGVGYCRNDLSKLRLLDPEQGALHDVAAWAYEQHLYQELLAFVNGCGFYCYVRGLMNRRPDINLAAADAAQALNSPLDELRWLSHHVQRMARIGNLSEAGKHLERMKSLAAKQTVNLRGYDDEPYQHSIASYYLAAGDVESAEHEWRLLYEDKTLANSPRLIAAKWLAVCLQQRNRLTGARAVLESAMQSVGPDSNQRAVISLHLQMVALCLDEDNLDEASRRLQQVSEQIRQDRVERHVPDVRLLEGRLLARQRSIAEARVAFLAAQDGFERIGLRRETNEASQALSRLEG